MNDRILPIVAIAISTVAIALSVGSKSGTGGVDVEDDQFEQRLRRLESQLAQIPRKPDPKLDGFAESDAIDPERAQDGDSLADVRRRQEDLEAYLNQLGVFEHFEAFKQKVASSYEIAIDPTRPAKQRLTSLGVLREAGRIDDEVIASMVTFWQQSLDDGAAGGWTRYFLLENLEGVNDPQFRDQILEWLPNEESAKMRARAIETLGPMMPDPGVEEWLTYLGENDPEPKVRQLAIDVRSRAAESK